MTAVATERSTFHERLAYARWLRQLKSVGENYTEFAERSGLSYEWLSKWKSREDAPRERMFCKALAAYLFVSEAWLFDGEGEPPRPELWASWIIARRET